MVAIKSLHTPLNTAWFCGVKKHPSTFNVTWVCILFSHTVGQNKEISVGVRLPAGRPIVSDWLRVKDLVREHLNHRATPGI